ncbi:hypothetical protein HAX54_020536, partial [Datura stramonium]|nr:hypothetical protein [Datura stramonium]
HLLKGRVVLDVIGRSVEWEDRLSLLDRVHIDPCSVEKEIESTRGADMEATCPPLYPTEIASSPHDLIEESGSRGTQSSFASSS